MNGMQKAATIEVWPTSNGDEYEVREDGVCIGRLMRDRRCSRGSHFYIVGDRTRQSYSSRMTAAVVLASLAAAARQIHPHHHRARTIAAA